LLQAADRKSSHQRWFYKLPAAADISSEAVLHLLQTAVGYGDWRSMGALCALPAVLQFSIKEGFALLSLAVDVVCYRTIQSMIDGLPAVLLDHIRREQVVQLLITSAGKGSSPRCIEATYELGKLAGLRRLSADQLVQVLVAVVKQGSRTTQLLKLPAARRLSREQMVQLLAATLEHGCDWIIL
jgi:hypothetical protein